MNKEKVIKTVVIAGVLVIVLYFLVKYIKTKINTANHIENNQGNVSSYYQTTGNTFGTSSSGSSSSSCTNSTILKKGSKCDRVQWAQYKINKVASQLGISKLTEDSVFGSKTENAFQKLLGKKTGSWNEVQAKVDSMLVKSSDIATELLFTDTGIKW